MLLYRFERQQFQDIKTKLSDAQLSDVYGAEHLLRLFVQMLALIANTNMDQDAITILKEHFHQFLW